MGDRHRRGTVGGHLRQQSPFPQCIGPYSLGSWGTPPPGSIKGFHLQWALEGLARGVSTDTDLGSHRASVLCPPAAGTDLECKQDRTTGPGGTPGAASERGDGAGDLGSPYILRGRRGPCMYVWGAQSAGNDTFSSLHVVTRLCWLIHSEASSWGGWHTQCWAPRGPLCPVLGGDFIPVSPHVSHSASC